MKLDDIKNFDDLLREIETSYKDDLRLKILLTVTAKAAYVMGQNGL